MKQLLLMIFIIQIHTNETQCIYTIDNLSQMQKCMHKDKLNASKHQLVKIVKFSKLSKW